jgi:hypothetical protein
MKITYEFADDEDHKRKLFDISDNMFASLWEISNYMRELRKGWKDDDAEKIEEVVSEIVGQSRIFEIE